MREAKTTLVLICLFISSVWVKGSQQLNPGAGPDAIQSALNRTADSILALKSAPAKKLQQQISSPRGEFSFHVPPGPTSYVVTATLKGFQTAREEIEIQGQEQINATLLLVPESKKAR